MKDSYPSEMENKLDELYYCPYLTALRLFPGYEKGSEIPGEV